MKRSVFIFILSAMLIISGCAVSDAGSPGITDPAARKLVGIALPTKTLTRWSEPPESGLWKRSLEYLGYVVDLQFSDNTQEIQNSQIEHMIELGCDLLIIDPVDGGGMDDVLKKAKEAGIKVIFCNKLPTDTDKCDYYVTFDNYAVSRMQGQYIADALGISAGAKGPFTLECFAVDPGDNNAYLYYEGAMEVLRPYIDSGAIVVMSGKTSRETMYNIVIPNREQEIMDDLLDAYYTEDNIDAVLSPNDSIARGIVASLKSHGYGSEDKPFPILTGQGCDKKNVGQIIRGEQSMSIFKDLRVLSYQVSMMAEAILSGKEVPVNTVYNNGVIDIPSYNCEIKLVDADNWKEVLIDTGYYREDDIPKQ